MVPVREWIHRRLLVCGAVLLAAIGLGQQAYASPIVIVDMFPASPITVVSSPFTVDVNISGVGNHADPTVGGFDITVFYDAAVLAPGIPIFGGAGGDLLDPNNICGSFCQVVLQSAGQIELIEASLETDANLQVAQPSAFTLFQLPFTSLVSLPTTTTLTLFTSYVVDGNGNPLVNNVGPVPEPGTWALGLAGLAGLMVYGRRRKRS